MKLLSLKESLKVYDRTMRQNPSQDVLFSDKESSIIKGLSERFKALYEAKKQQSFSLGGKTTDTKKEESSYTKKEEPSYGLKEGDLFIIPMSVNIPKPYLNITEYVYALSKDKDNDMFKYLSHNLFIKGTLKSKYVYTSEGIKDDVFQYIYSRVFVLKSIRKEMSIKETMQSIYGGTVTRDKWVTEDQFISKRGSQSSVEADKVFLDFGYDGSFNNKKEYTKFYRSQSKFYHPDKFINRLEEGVATPDQKKEYEQKFQLLSSAKAELDKSIDIPRSTTKFKPTRFTMIFVPVFEDYTGVNFEDKLKKLFRFVSDEYISDHVPKLIRYYGQQENGNLVLKLNKERFDKFELKNKHALDYEEEEILQRFYGNVEDLESNEDIIVVNIVDLIKFRNNLDMNEGYLIRRELNNMVTYSSGDLIAKYAKQYIVSQLNLKSEEPYYSVEYVMRSSFNDFKLVLSNWFYKSLRSIGIYDTDNIQYVATEIGVKLYVDEATYGTVDSFLKWIINSQKREQKFSIKGTEFKYGDSVIFKKANSTDWILYPTINKSSFRIAQTYLKNQDSFDEFMLDALTQAKGKEVVLIGNVPFLYDDLLFLNSKIDSLISDASINVNFRNGTIDCELFTHNVRWQGDDKDIEPLMYYVYSRIKRTNSKIYLKPYKDIFSQKFIDKLEQKRISKERKTKKQGDKLKNKADVVSKMFPNYPTKEQLEWQYHQKHSLQVSTCAIHIKSSNEVVINKVSPRNNTDRTEYGYESDLLKGATEKKDNKSMTYLWLGSSVYYDAKKEGKGYNLLNCSSNVTFKNNLFKDRKLIFEGKNANLKVPKFLFTRGNLNKYGASLLIWYLKQFGFKVDSSWNIPIFLNGTLLPIGSWSGLTIIPKSQQNRFKKEIKELNK